MCDLIFSGVFERHPRLTLAIVEFELAWAPHLLSTMDYTYRERHGEAIYRFKYGMLPSDFFRRNVVLSFQEDAIGIRLRDVIGVDNMMWGSDYPHSESTFPQSRKILAGILAGVPEGRPGQDRRRQHRPRLQFRRGAADRPCLKRQPLCGLTSSACPRRFQYSSCSTIVTSQSHPPDQSLRVCCSPKAVSYDERSRVGCCHMRQ